MFIPYPHLERHGKEDVSGICAGTCYIFPKIDGTNGSVWNELCTLTMEQNGVDGQAYQIRAGSRNRELTLDKDNHGFYEAILKDENIKAFLTNYPQYRLYGEWLVPHTFKGYRNDAWRKFYVFDVGESTADGELRLLPYEEYKLLMDEFKIEYIPAVKIIKNPSDEELLHELNNNFFLVEAADKPGEGIVIKNYDYKNKWGHQVWAKMVREEFKEKNLMEFGTPEAGQKKIEEDIIQKYILQSALCEKTYNKIINEQQVDKKLIPRVLETVYHELIVEETWNYLKEHNNPTIDFKRLKALCIQATKKMLPQMFL